MTPPMLISPKEMLRLSKEVYPDTYLPPHLSVTIDGHTYYRGSKSYIRCRDCGDYIGNGRAMGTCLCGNCYEKVWAEPLVEENYKATLKRERDYIVLCGYHGEPGY
jgi:hypothetical protein